MNWLGDTDLICSVSNVDQYRATEWTMTNPSGATLADFPLTNASSADGVMVETSDDYDDSAYTVEETLVMMDYWIGDLPAGVYTVVCGLELDGSYNDTMTVEVFIPGTSMEPAAERVFKPCRGVIGSNSLLIR